MRVLMVGRLYAANQDLVNLAQIFIKSEQEVILTCGYAQDSVIYPPALMGSSPDFVLASISHNYSDEWAVIVQAKQRKIPFGIVAYEANFLEKLSPEVIRSCSLLLLSGEPREAKRLGFKNIVSLRHTGFADVDAKNLQKVTKTILDVIALGQAKSAPH